LGFDKSLIIGGSCDKSHAPPAADDGFVGELKQTKKNH
jgi:hypothetical protein